MRPQIKTWKGDYLPFAHYKRDGHYLEVVKDAMGSVSCWSSRPRDLTHQVLNQVAAGTRLATIPFETILLGELWYPECRAEDIKTRIKNRSVLYFDCFGIRSQLIAADAPLHEVEELCKSWGVSFAPFVTCEKTPPSDWIKLPLQPNCEGYVFKRGNLIGWQKWKPIKTIDLVVSGFTEGDGKFLGLIGALVCQTTEGYEVANVGTMTDEVRADISFRPRSYLGKVIEVAYQYVGSQGRLRHPRLVRFRSDKDPAKCKADQDPELQKYWYERCESCPDK